MGSNEFYPRFQQPVFQFAVSESAIPDTAVGQIRAIDLDEGKDGEVFYFLIGQSNDRGFKINKTSGVISVQKSLDRESQNRFVLTVLAKNRGSILGNDTDEAQVIIQVQDGLWGNEVEDPGVGTVCTACQLCLLVVDEGVSLLTGSSPPQQVTLPGVSTDLVPLLTPAHSCPEDVLVEPLSRPTRSWLTAGVTLAGLRLPDLVRGHTSPRPALRLQTSVRLHC